MKVGDYVRTKDGKIGKIIQEEYITPCNDKHRYIYLIDADNEMWYDEDTIIKSSSNIINLIEVGDYVDGYRVNFIYSPDGKNVFRIELEVDGLKGHFISNSESIKSIVTKEQFESMKYEVN